MIDLSSVNRLPLRIRRIQDESLSSYIRRAAAANGVTVETVAEWARDSLGVHASADPAGWRYLWAVLAPSAGPAPIDPARYDAPHRLICGRCAGGVTATGPQPSRGLLCLRHERWID